MEADQAARIDVLERRIAALESEVAQLRQHGVAAADWSPPRTVTAPDPHWPGPVLPPAPADTPSDAPQPARGAAPPELDVERLLRWGGVGLVVLAITFAVSTAVSRGWIGRELQLAGALAVSIALCAGAVWLRDRRPPWHHALGLAGVLGAHLTVASPLLRDLAPDTAAAVATVVVAIVGVALAVHLDAPWLAAAVAVAGPTGWFAAFGGDPPPPATAMWTIAVLGGVLAVAVPRRWDEARVVAMVAASGFIVPTADAADGSAARIVVAAAGLVVMAAWCALPSRGSTGSEWRAAEVQAAMLVGPWAILMVGLVGELVDDVSIGVCAVAVAAAIAAFALLLRTRLVDAHVVSLAVSASLASSIALGLLLGESTYALGFALQGAGLLLLETKLRPNLRILVNGIAVLALAALILAGRLIGAWIDDASAAADVAHTLALVAIVVVTAIEVRRQLRVALAVATLVLVLLWLGSLLVHLPQGQAVVSISWAVVGIALVVAGAVRKVPPVAQAGLIVLGVTVAKLLTVDLSEVDTLWRAGLFLAIGLGFLRLGFLLPKLTGVRQDAESTEALDGTPPHAS